MRVLASERARRGEGREGRERARGRRGRRRWARAPRGGRLVGLTPGRGGTLARSALGAGAPGMAGSGRAGARGGGGRHAPAGVSWGRASGWAGQVEFASRRRGTSRPGRGPHRGGEPRPTEARRGPLRVRPRSLPVPTCVQDLRDRVNALPCPTLAGGPNSTPHPGALPVWPPKSRLTLPQGTEGEETIIGRPAKSVFCHSLVLRPWFQTSGFPQWAEMDYVVAEDTQ